MAEQAPEGRAQRGEAERRSSSKRPKGARSEAEPGEVHRAGSRAGFAALLGRANAGKSTLMNRLLGEKLAIATARPQTTRSRLLGILPHGAAQILLVDTPGLRSSGRRRLDAALNRLAEQAADECDVGVLLADPAEGFGPELAALHARLAARRTPVLLVGTKLDLPAAAAAPWPPEGAGPAAAVLRVSARTGAGIPALLDEIAARLPEGPPLYPPDELSDRPLRFLAAELVREAAFEALEQELPYALAVEVVDFDESREDLVRIRANLLVERQSQRGIAIGAGGAMIKRIGTQARRELESLLGRRVHLELWAKVEPGWSRSEKRLRSLGYS
jgi:GTP-binding protein Era